MHVSGTLVAAGKIAVNKADKKSQILVGKNTCSLWHVGCLVPKMRACEVTLIFAFILYFISFKDGQYLPKRRY